MTANQFQRDVVDILKLNEMTPEGCLAVARAFTNHALEQTNVPMLCAEMAVSLVALVQGSGYSLETIFQMALDKLEEFGK